MTQPASKHRWGIAAGGIFLTLLLSVVFTLGSLKPPITPGSWRDRVVLYALSAFVSAAFIVFGLVLLRTIIRLGLERSRNQLGARFKTKMVIGAMAISLLPIVFMFVVSYSLLNRTLLAWFPQPLEIASQETQSLLNDFGQSQIPRLRNIATQAAALSPQPLDLTLQRSFGLGADALWIFGAKGNFIRGGVVCPSQPEDRSGKICFEPGVRGELVRTLPSGIEVWQSQGSSYLAARVPFSTRSGAGLAAQGVAVAAYRTNPDFMRRISEIQRQTHEYFQEKQDLRTLKRQLLFILSLFTLLLFFSVTWVALFLAKQVTVPIQALAEGTREVSAGNFDYQVPEQTQDELGTLVRSFNAMTTQLRDNRGQIDQFTRNLQQAVQELERRRQLMETVLENVPTAVISLDSGGAILRENSAVARMFGAAAREGHSLEQLLGADAFRTVQHLMRRSLRMGVASREIETIVSGRVLHVAVTVSALGPRRANSGYVVVLDDLTEMLRAQKSAAWQEVARRIAHEIKNPLTPIQLSAQRLARFLERRESASAPTPDPELARLVQECSRLIEREVSSLAGLVNEFSQFVRFPAAKLASASANTIVSEAAEVFAGRLDGITLKTSLADGPTSIRADCALLRGVIVNLIDNAAEALEGAPFREITVSTRLHFDSETVEISVRDTGNGISPEDKDRLFLPHFSTKDRGTGLGLAIAARIVAEHGGNIRVEDNFPVGSSFVIELPAADLVPAPAGDRDGVEAT